MEHPICSTGDVFEESLFRKGGVYNIIIAVKHAHRPTKMFDNAANCNSYWFTMNHIIRLINRINYCEQLTVL